MKNLCETEELIQPGFFQRLFNILPKENAFIEVNNLFASKPFEEIKSTEIEAISAKYKVDLHEKFAGRLKEIYQRHLEQSISDMILPDQEITHNNYLKKLLMLNDAEVEEIHNQFAGEIYKKSYNKVISDGKIDESERAFLEKLQKNLKLPGIAEEKISNESTQQFMQNQVDKIVEDGKISPQEWEEFAETAKNLDVDVNWNEETKAMVEKLKIFWLIEHGDLPVKEVSVNLQDNEYCYFSSDGDWLENLTAANSVNSEKSTEHIKIVKGEYYRAGAIDVQSIGAGNLQNTDAGQIYLTNQRIIFIGNKKKLNIQINKISSIIPFSDGLEVETGIGGCQVFRLAADADLFAMTLTRVINDFQI